MKIVNLIYYNNRKPWSKCQGLCTMLLNTKEKCNYTCTVWVDRGEKGRDCH